MKIQFDSTLYEYKIDTEDGGQAKIVEVPDDGQDGLFVRIHSWDETKEHTLFNSLVGKRVRVTIETLE